MRNSPIIHSMSLMAADRLFGALLVEMVSGHYMEGERFLSHRRIMRQWRVAAGTANLALRRLRTENVLGVKDRSGHYLPEGFRERALRVLHGADELADASTPLQQHRLSMKVLLNWRTGCPVKSVAVVLVLMRGDGRLRPEEHDATLARCAASSLTAKGIFLEAECLRVPIHFFLCNGTSASGERTLGRVLNARPDGVILIKRMASFREETLGKSFLQRGIPVVTLYSEGKDSDMVWGNFNNVGIGVSAADAFLRKGHRKLAVLTYETGNANFEDRLRGFSLRAAEEKRTSVTEFRLPMKPERSLFQSVVVGLRRKRITALFSTTAELLDHFFPVLHEAGIRVPDDLSVLMCSSVPKVANFPRPLDTFILDFVQIGRTAMRALNSYCSGQVAQKTHLLKPALEVHGSVLDCIR